MKFGNWSWPFSCLKSSAIIITLKPGSHFILHFVLFCFFLRTKLLIKIWCHCDVGDTKFQSFKVSKFQNFNYLYIIRFSIISLIWLKIIRRTNHIPRPHFMENKIAKYLGYIYFNIKSKEFLSTVYSTTKLLAYMQTTYSYSYTYVQKTYKPFLSCVVKIDTIFY